MSFEWLDGLVALGVTWGVTAVGGLALIILGFFGARIVRSAVSHALRHVGLDGDLIDILAAIAYYMTVAVVLIAAFGVMGIETASLITILGTCTLAIGLALQGSLSNFAAGIMLLMFRPFKVGDLIETGDYLGRVADIGVFSTQIDTLQNIRVELPNSYVSQRPLSNWSRNTACRLDLRIEISIECDSAAVKHAIAAALTAEPRVLDEPPPFIGIENYGDSSAIYVIRPWCSPDDFWTLKVELPEAVRDAITAVDATMPTPRREVVMIGST
jgi:small conductance mechanosensitive channel